VLYIYIYNPSVTTTKRCSLLCIVEVIDWIDSYSVFSFVHYLFFFKKVFHFMYFVVSLVSQRSKSVELKERRGELPSLPFPRVPRRL